MVKVFITTITFNSHKATLECLESIEKLEKENFELFVMVIDNASKEVFETSREYKNFKLKVLRSEENLGFSGGQNLGIRNALKEGADFIIVLNNDTILNRKLIKSLIASFKADVGIVSPKIYFAKGYEFHKDRYKETEKGKVFWYAGGIIDWSNVIAKHRGVDEVDKEQYSKVSEIEFATGCCMALRKEIFQNVGFFDDKYFLYLEDCDLSKRVKMKKLKVIYQPNAVLWHKNAASAGGSGSALQDYYITRNRLLFGFKYSSFRTKLALIRESIRIAYSGRKWQRKGVIDFYLRRFGKGSFSP